MKKNFSKIGLILVIVIVITLVKYFNIESYFTLDFIKENQAHFLKFYEENKITTILSYMIIYITTTALSIPGATILTLAGGGIFGLLNGTIIVSFASTIGATLAFLASRFLLKDFVQNRFQEKLKQINEGIEKEGAFYLFTLRLLPIFPFFLINLVMGLTPLSAIKFFLVSQIGMLLGTIVYVNAGVELAKIDSLSGILSPNLVIAFSLLGLIPIITKRIVEYLKAMRVYKNWKRPLSYDYNMISIGAGAGGLVTSYIGATVKAKVALIEKHQMGGDCLNTGCVPSKALIKTAKVAYLAKNSHEYAIESINFKVDFQKVMTRIKEVIKKIEPHDSIERYTSLGVDCIQGSAKIISPFEVEVNGKRLTTKNITIATGARPFIPNLPGIENAMSDNCIVTSDTIWDLKELPKEFLILGAGPIGLEMAQSFARLGSNVTVVEMAERVMIKEDPDVSKAIQMKLENEGIKFYTGFKASEFIKNDRQYSLACEGREEKVQLDFDICLLSIGRKANTSNFGLEDIGVELNPNGTIKTNEFLQTNYPNIFACGDVAGPYQLTHTAAHQAWYCAVNGLFGKFKKFKADYSVIPWATYTDPEVATVGLNEQEAKLRNISYEITRYDIDDLDRAIADSEDFGFVKVLTKPGSDKILGATIVGQNASELIIEFISAMKNGFGLNKILGTIHPYPTMSEANKYAAGEWKRARKPDILLKLVEKFHSWNRG